MNDSCRKGGNGYRKAELVELICCIYLGIGVKRIQGKPENE